MGSNHSPADVLLLNDRVTPDGRHYTVPHPKLYPFQWNWDSAFAALGWAGIGEWDRAWEELTTLSKGAHPDGMWPHIVFWTRDGDYFPGPDQWGTAQLTPARTNITQPAVAITVAATLARQDPDRRRAHHRAGMLHDPLAAWSAWWASVRDAGRLRRAHAGAVVCVHPWESGTDNSPAYDPALANVPVTVDTAAQRRDTATVARDQRPTTSDYDAYMSLVSFMQSVRWSQPAVVARSLFAVADPLLTAVCARACNDGADLARIGGNDPQVWLERGRVHQAGLASLWIDNWYRVVDLHTGVVSRVRTCGGAVGLWAGVEDAHAEHMAEVLDSWALLTGGLPSSDPQDETFDPVRYWRGPLWANVAWMTAHGLRAAGYADVAQLLAAPWADTGDYPEYLAAGTLESLGATQFTWTAALGAYGWERSLG